MAKNQSRDPKRERFWRDTVSAWRSSDLPVREFRDRRGVTRTAFGYWRSPTFVPVTVLATPS